MKPRTYIAALQQAGIDRSLIDAWAHNPYPGERRKGSVRVALFDDGPLERGIACRVRVR